MIYFTSRSKARNFSKGNKKVVDMGASAAKRWAVKVL